MKYIGTAKRLLSVIDEWTLRKTKKYIRAKLSELVQQLRLGHSTNFTISDIVYTTYLMAYTCGRIIAIGNNRKQRIIIKKAEPDEQLITLYKLLIKPNAQIIEKLIRVPVSKLPMDSVLELFAPSIAALTVFETYSMSLNLLDQTTTKKTQRWVLDTIQQGMSEREATIYLKQKLGAELENRAQKIARTEATRAYNLGTYEESFDSGIVEGYRFNAVLDERTTEICRARHGIYIPKNDIGILAQNTPPLHVNCRSLLEPVTTFDKKPTKTVYDLPVDEKIQPQTRDGDTEFVYNYLQAKVGG